MSSCTASQMFALNRSSRALLATSAFAAFAGAFVTAPLVARGAADDHIVRTAPAPPAATAGAFALVVPRRDPFAGDPPAAPSSPPTALMSPIISTPPASEIPAAIRPLPPNAGAAGSALPFAAPPRITAVVTGDHPFALLDEGGTTRVVTVGDRIDGVVIRAITATAVRLADGTMLAVAATPSTGAPSFSPISKGHQP
jgi:hypothetical protein